MEKLVKVTFKGLVTNELIHVFQRLIQSLHCDITSALVRRQTSFQILVGSEVYSFNTQTEELSKCFDIVNAQVLHKMKVVKRRISWGNLKRAALDAAAQQKKPIFIRNLLTTVPMRNRENKGNAQVQIQLHKKPGKQVAPRLTHEIFTACCLFL